LTAAAGAGGRLKGCSKRPSPAIIQVCAGEGFGLIFMKTILFCVSILAAAGQNLRAEESLLLRTLNRGPGIIYSLAYSPDGKYIASGGVAKTLEIWNAEDGTPVKSLKGHANFINSVVYSPDGRTIATAGEDKTVKLWNAEDGACLGTLKGHKDAVMSVAFFPDGKSLASAGNDGTIRLWKAGEKKPYRTLQPRVGDIYSVAVSSDGTRLAAGSASRGIKLWELGPGGRETTLEGHKSAVNAVAFSRAGDYLASGSEDGTVKIWRLSDGLCVMTAKPGQPVYAIAYTTDNNYIFSGGSDNMATAWNAADGRQIRTFAGHSRQVKALAVSPDGQYLATSSHDRTIKLWLNPWEADKRAKALKDAADAEAEKNKNYELHYTAGLQLASSWLITDLVKAETEFRTALTFKTTKECEEKLGAATAAAARMKKLMTGSVLGFILLLAFYKVFSKFRRKAGLRKNLPEEIRSDTFAGSYDSALAKYNEYKAVGGKPGNLPREELFALFRGLNILEDLGKENLPYHFLLSYAAALAKESNYSTALGMLRSGRIVDEFKTPADYDTFVDIYERAGKPENLLVIKLEPPAYSALAEAFFRVGDYRSCGRMCALKKQFHPAKVTARDTELLADSNKYLEEKKAPSAIPDVARWGCINCNYVHEGPDVPDSCPTCAKSKEYFKLL